MNSDMKADLINFRITQEGPNYKRVTGTKGYRLPTTTKLAILYVVGY